MRLLRNRLGVVFLAMLLTTGLVAPASADHNAEHSALEQAVTDAQAALDDAQSDYDTAYEQYLDDLAAWQLEKDAYDEFDFDAYNAALAAYDDYQTELAALQQTVDDLTNPQGDCVGNDAAKAACNAAKDALAAKIAEGSPLHPGDAPSDPGSAPEAPSDAAVVAAQQVLDDAIAALENYEDPAPEVTDEGDSWDESNASDTAGQCAPDEGAVKYNTGDSYDENILIGDTVVRVVVDGKTVTFTDAATGEPFNVDSFCVKAGNTNSGPQSGSSYTVNFDNQGGQFPDISNLVIYASVPTPEVNIDLVKLWLDEDGDPTDARPAGDWSVTLTEDDDETDSIAASEELDETTGIDWSGWEGSLTMPKGESYTVAESGIGSGWSQATCSADDIDYVEDAFGQDIGIDATGLGTYDADVEGSWLGHLVCNQQTTTTNGGNGGNGDPDEFTVTLVKVWETDDEDVDLDAVDFDEVQVEFQVEVDGSAIDNVVDGGSVEVEDGDEIEILAEQVDGFEEAIALAFDDELVCTYESDAPQSLTVEDDDTLTVTNTVDCIETAVGGEIVDEEPTPSVDTPEQPVTEVRGEVVEREVIERTVAAEETEVLGATLARTGASVFALLLLAFGALLSGGLLARRRDQEA